MKGKTFLRVLKFAARSRALIAVAAVCATIFALSNVFSMYILRPLMNSLVEGTATARSLAQGIAVLAGIYLLGVLGRFAQQFLMVRISQDAVKAMREELFEKLQKLPLSYFDNTPNGDTMSCFTNDLDAITNMLNTAVMGLLIAAVQLAVTLGLMLYTHWQLTLLTLVLSGAIMLLSVRLLKTSEGKYDRQQAQIGVLNAYAEEIVSGQKIVKLFGREEITEAEFDALNEETCRMQESAQYSGGIIEPVLANLCRGVYAVTALAGGLLCVSRGFDIGGLTVFVYFAGNFCAPVAEVASQVSSIFTALAGADRVFSVMDRPEEADLESAPVRIRREAGGNRYRAVAEYAAVDGREVKGHVLLEHVSFGYTPGVQILKDLSVDVPAGQKLAIVDSTGAGKTTIINLVNRFYEIDSGKISIDGTDVRDICLEDLRRCIAIVLQDTHLFTGTVRENIRYGRLEATDQEVEDAARLASADSFISHLEKGYDTLLENDAANLSQGQRQLLSIARAAVSRAPILILDEATSSVDTLTEKHIQEGMDRLMENRTTFVIAHRLSTVRNADQILYLDAGRILEQGTHEELMDRKGRYYSLYTGKTGLN